MSIEDIRTYISQMNIEEIRAYILMCELELINYDYCIDSWDTDRDGLTDNSHEFDDNYSDSSHGSDDDDYNTYYLNKKSNIRLNNNQCTIPNPTAKPHAKYRQTGIVEKVFRLADKIPGRDPDVYRKDPYDKTMIYYQYGEGKNVIGSWEIDHIKPKKYGGSDDIRNLQALSFETNRSLGCNTKNKKSRHDVRRIQSYLKRLQ